MNTSPVTSPLRRLDLYVAIIATVAWALLLALAPGIATAQLTGAVLPTIRAWAVTAEVNDIAVHGDGFTPGGLVKISLVLDSGAPFERQEWTVASSDAYYGPQGSIDPAQGYIPAGVVHAVIPLSSMAIFGPHGSQDPAQGYFDQQALAESPMCSVGFDVQAMDFDTGAMSALAHIAPSCSSDSEVSARVSESNDDLSQG